MQRRRGGGDGMSAGVPSGPAWWSHLLQSLEPITRHLVLVILLAMTAIVFAQAVSESRTDPGSADRASIVVARDLYAGGTQDQPPSAHELQIRPPVYPLVLAAMAYLDPNVASGLSCAGEPPDGCESGFPFFSVVVLQTLAAMLCLLLIYRLASRLSGSRAIAIITLLLAFVWGRYADFAGNLFGHTFYQLGVVASLYLLVPQGGQLLRRRALAAGAVAGLTALIEPTFLFVIPVAALLLAYSNQPSGKKVSVSLLAGSAFSIILVLTVALLAGYDQQGIARHMTWSLAERAAFNQLHGAAWWAAFLLPVPIFGPVFGLLLPVEIVDSFGYYTPGTYVFDGTNRILPEALAQPGSAWHQLFWLLRTHIIGEPVAYLSSSGALFVRGVWAGGSLIALIGIFQISPMLRWARIDSRYESTLLVVVLTATLLLAGTLLTSNPNYLHPMLVFVYAYAIAYLAGGR